MLYKFDEILVDDTKSCKKIKKQDYLTTGKYPIIDQGQTKVSGYWNDAHDLYEDVPAIIFGDHTRVVKYIDNPFFIGADGVKVLKCKNKDVNYKYLFYLLKSIYIPNTGYNRHFKWIKNTQFYVHDIKDQKRIVNTLEFISNIINLRRQQLEKLDLLVKAKFSEMFSENNFPFKCWDDVFNVKTGKLDSNASKDNGRYAFFTCSKKPLRIDTYSFDQEALLLSGNNAAGKYDVKYYKGKFDAYQRTYVLSLKELGSYRMFQLQLEEKLQQLQNQSLGGLTKYLTLKILQNLKFVVPDIETQKEFENFVCFIDKEKTNINKSLELYKILNQSLKQKYFMEH